MNEFDLIRELLVRTDTPDSPLCRLGPGDDAAVLDVPAGQQLVLSIDTLNESVHFLPSIRPADLGWRVLAVNLSDLAAMGATPAWFLLSLSLPSNDAAWLADFASGLGLCARHYGVALVGGDTTRGPLSVTVQIGGLAPSGQALRRDGALAGDLVCVSGVTGEAAAGLRLQQEGLDQPGRLVERFLRPRPRLQLGAGLHGLASAVIDVSDGLLQDLAHVLEASGRGACLELERVPLSAEAVAAFGEDAARAMALAGGDDYELCFTVPVGHWPRVQELAVRLGLAVSVIGEILPEPGLFAADGRGGRMPLAPAGYQHFGSE